MRKSLVSLILVVLAPSALPAAAQTPPPPLELSESGRSYLETVGRRVNGDVGYYSPTGAIPELATGEAPPKPARDGREGLDPGTLKLLLGAAAVLALAAVLFQVWRFGAPVSVSLRARPRDAASAPRPKRNAGEAPDAAAPTLAEIMAVADRNAALVDLARGALARAAARHDMRWRTSWTARELLGRLPHEVAYGLRPLVRAAEHVQFGGRDVTEAEFARFVAVAAPLLEGDRA